MPGPQDSTSALRWIQDAVTAGRYKATGHFFDRLSERKIEFEDVFDAIENALRCLPYERQPDHNGTCWRVIGSGIDENKMIAIGVEAYLDKKKRKCALCTVFDPND